MSLRFQKDSITDKIKCWTLVSTLPQNKGHLEIHSRTTHNSEIRINVTDTACITHFTNIQDKYNHKKA
jgi:hypothetical protein